MLTALAAFPTVAPVAGHEADEAFAAALQRVIRASRENFRPIEGARIEFHPGNKSYYQARVDLPGTTECRIDEPPNLVYSCKWKPPQSLARGASPCDKLLSDIQSALGTEWSRVDLTKPREGKMTFRNRGRYSMTEVGIISPTKTSPVCTIAISIVPAANSTSK